MRAEVKNRLKYSQGSLKEVIERGQTDDMIGKLKVVSLLESLPGVGKVNLIYTTQIPRHKSQERMPSSE